MMFWRMGSGRDHGAGKLMSYISRDAHELRDRYGNEMDERDKQQFIERSEEYSHEKQVILSPERGDELSDREMSLAVRKSMSEFTKERPSADYCFAIHRDTEHPHAQVALTGTREDLYVEIEERREVRERAQEHFREKERERRRERQHERERERERTQDRDRSRGRSL
jgi:hypothetical protein